MGCKGTSLSSMGRKIFPFPWPILRLLDCGDGKELNSVLVYDFSALRYSRRQHPRQGSASLQWKAREETAMPSAQRFYCTQQPWRWAKIPARGGHFTNLLELRKTKSQHHLDTNCWFIAFLTSRLVRPGDIHVTKTSIQQLQDPGLQSL